MGQLLVNQSLPPDLRDYNRVLDKKGVQQLLDTVARKYPEKYAEIAKNLSDVGRKVAYHSGGFGVGLESLRQTQAAKIARINLARDLQQVYSNRSLTPDQTDAAVLETVGKYQQALPGDVFKEAVAANNPLALQAVSGARGSQTNVNSLIGADLLYEDHRGRPVPIPILRNYSMGLSPAEHFAGAFGARKGTLDLKKATGDAGFLSKQISQAVHRLLVTANDADSPYDESQPRGLEVSTDDADNEGSLLSHPVGGYGRNTVLTPKILKELRAAGHDNILVRSPAVGGPDDGGVYARDAGYREKGGLPPRGDMIGLAGAHAVSEPLTQSQISSKHSGGVAGASAGAIGGFAVVNAMVQAPEIFPGGAVHSQMDGRVEHIVEAPQGGHYATISGQQHYIPRGAVMTAKKGDTVEAGDTITEGIPNPAEIVRHKGVGEGRRYFIDSFRKVLKNSQIGAHRRNVELLARGLLNHVRLTDEVGDWGPDDVVPYQTLESQWSPRPGYLVAPAKSLVGHYLERPILHYSVGTKIRPSMVQKLDQYGVKSIYAHPEAPPFEPEMVRAMMNTSHDPDWQTKMLGSYQQSSVLEAARRGGMSDNDSTSYVPSLASSPTFGDAKIMKGWNPADIGRKPVDLTTKPKITSLLD